MLNAILHAKSGRHGEAEARTPWRETFRANEDHITATLFERLSYLSGSTAMSILAEATRRDAGGDGAKLFGWRMAEITEIAFWPKWDISPEQGRYREPDLFMTIKAGDPQQVIHLIVEAKKGDAEQKQHQWCDQLGCYDPGEQDDAAVDMLGYLAIGGRVQNPEAFRAAARKIRSDTLFAIAGWEDMARGVAQALEATVPAEARILKDMQEALTLFGYLHVKFEDTLKHMAEVDTRAVTSFGAWT
tara:strand:+ start:230 stop:964 length:735 start_codon:yes stop_codon:yes gene_type:complete